MARWYKVTFTDGSGICKEYTPSGNTRKSAERSARSRLREEIGEGHRKWWAVSILPAKAPADAGGPR